MRSGVFRFARELLSPLQLLGVHVTIVGPEAVRQNFQDCDFVSVEPAWRRIVGRKKIFWRAASAATYRNLRTSGRSFRLVHGLSNFNAPGPDAAGIPSVLTVHDIIPHVHPTKVSLAQALQHRALMPGALENASLVICSSRWTADTVATRFPGMKAKIVRLTPGCTAVSPQQVRDAVARRATRSVTSSFEGRRRHTELLVVSRFEEYKNLGLTIDLLRAAPASQYRATVVTDRRGSEFLAARGGDLLRRDLLVLRSGIEDGELAHAYDAADVLLAPSLCEGYGLPVVEALAHGLPCVYRTGSGMDDAAGLAAAATSIGVSDAAIVSNGLTTAWLQAIGQAERLISSTTRPFADVVCSELALRPTWTQTAERLKEMYNQICVGR